MHDILRESGETVAYGLVGIALMALSFLVVEASTSGQLRHKIWNEGNSGCALLLSGKLIGMGAIVTTAAITSDDKFGAGLVETVVFGLLGILLMMLAFYLLDWFTPGRLEETLLNSQGDTVHPAGWVVAAADLAVAAVICGAVS